ncbi:MAG: ABC transporter substrate-binding protein [Treponema sp.]|nr:ABC transporter substrate-binding protein [Treponema sp.]
MKKLVLMVLLVSVIAGGLVLGACNRGGGRAPDAIHIEVVSKGFLHEFWQNVYTGAKQAADELGVTINFVGPESEADIDVQTDMFETALVRSPSAIAFAALDAVAQESLVARAVAQGIPVVTFDATVRPDTNVSSFVATNSLEAGSTAATKMNEALGGMSGKVAVIASDMTNTTQTERRDGFLNAARDIYPNIEIVAVVYGVDPFVAEAEVTSVLIANPDLAGFYACNEGTAIGLANALRNTGRVGRVIGIGFDSGRLQLDAIRDGTLHGAIQQNPRLIGYQAIQFAHDAYKGLPVPKVFDTGIVWADKNNIDSPEVQAVIYQ